jgi:adenosylcobinamide amidohydrolase
MMTAASMKTLSHSALTKAGITVECWVTAGLGNLRSVGDTADEVPVAGTINIALLINKALSDAALAEALILLTEAKVSAIQQAGLLSPVSNKPASGTGTDSHAVFAKQQGEAMNYCGKHTLLGELIGKAVFTASAQSIEKCLAA